MEQGEMSFFTVNFVTADACYWSEKMAMSPRMFDDCPKTYLRGVWDDDGKVLGYRKYRLKSKNQHDHVITYFEVWEGDIK